MKQLFSSSYLTISLHEGPTPALELIWLDFVNSRDLRASLQEALRLARLHRIRSWIADNSLIRALRPADIDWIAQDIILPLNQLGVKRMAIVESRDAINRLGINAMLSAVIPNTTISAQYFPTLAEARAWACQ